MISTKEIYNGSADNWNRSEPVLLSDYTARPIILDMCEPVKGLRILDLGCGEGYCSRQLMKRGAASVDGIDISEKMIEKAQNREAEERLGITYRSGNAASLDPIEDASYDMVLAVFLFNYLSLDHSKRVAKQVHRILKPGGIFTFAFPHPLYAFLRANEYPFYFDPKESGYFSGRDKTFMGKIWRRDGVDVTVQSVHKTFEDYFEALRAGGFEGMPILKELKVSPEHIDLDQKFFQPIHDLPLHVVVQVRK